MSLILFSLGWIAVIYFFNSAIAGRLKRIHLETALLYVSSVILLGVFGEVLIDSLYNAVFGQPLWQYHLLPIHNAYASYYSLVIWGMYGFYLYLLHDNLNVNGDHSTRKLAAIISIEAIVLEVLLNLSFLTIFHQYIFYYLPNDLWHVTSMQAIPVYFLAGFLILRLIRGAKADPGFFIATNLTLVSIFVFLVN